MDKCVCLDCVFEDLEPEGEFCEHFTPEYWEQQGYMRSWGDAAVMNWPHLEILKRIEDDGADRQRTQFVVLAPYAARRPIIIYGYGAAHGSY